MSSLASGKEVLEGLSCGSGRGVLWAGSRSECLVPGEEIMPSRDCILEPTTLPTPVLRGLVGISSAAATLAERQLNHLSFIAQSLYLKMNENNSQN